MIRKKAEALRALALGAGLGLSAVAGAATTMRLQVAEAGSEVWGSTIDAKPGDAIDIRVTVSFTGGPVTPLGLSSTIFQPTVSNWLSSDAVGPMVSIGSNSTTPLGAVPDAAGQYGRILPFAAAGMSSSQRLFAHVHAPGPATGGVGYVRIAQRQVTSWFGGVGNTSGGSGVNVKQFNLNGGGRDATVQPPFSSALTDVVLFKFKIVLSAADTSARTLVADAPIQGIFSGPAGHPYVGWYANPDEEVGSIFDLPTIERGFINVPGPGALALAGIGGVAWFRRRR